MVPVARGARHGRRLLRRRSKSETITIADPRIRGVSVREESPYDGFVFQHTDRNLLWWRTPGIRFMVSKFAFTADRGVLAARSSTSRSGRGCLVRSRHGCAMPRFVQRSLWAAQGSRSMR